MTEDRLLCPGCNRFSLTVPVAAPGGTLMKCLTCRAEFLADLQTPRVTLEVAELETEEESDA